MHNGSYFIERDRIHPFFNPGAMNNEEGLYISWETDPTTARRVLPPMLELLDPAHPIVTVYAVNIREPTFASWYMEAGMMLLCRFGDKPGVYFTNLQLSGPGAAMGLLSGREFSGLPKKVCERIVVERTDNYARALVEAKGRRIFDAEIEIGSFDGPGPEEHAPGSRQEASVFLFRYETGAAPDGHFTFPKMHLLEYQSVTEYRTWETGRVTSITMEPSLDDPWAELVVAKPLAAAWSINSNWAPNLNVLAQYEGDEADALISYLFTGRWDRSTIAAHQRYGQL